METTEKRSFGREFAENLAIQVGGALIQLVLFVVPAAVGYFAGGLVGLVIGAVVGAVLVGLFWIVVVMLAAGEIGNLLRRKR